MIQISRQLEEIISLLKKMPVLICDEMEKRQQIRKELEIKRIQEDMEVARHNLKEIDKMMRETKKDG